MVYGHCRATANLKTPRLSKFESYKAADSKEVRSVVSPQVLCRFAQKAKRSKRSAPKSGRKRNRESRSAKAKINEETYSLTKIKKAHTRIIRGIKALHIARVQRHKKAPLSDFATNHHTKHDHKGLKKKKISERHKNLMRRDTRHIQRASTRLLRYPAAVISVGILEDMFCHIAGD